MEIKRLKSLDCQSENDGNINGRIRATGKGYRAGRVGTGKSRIGKRAAVEPERHSRIDAKTVI